MSNLELDALVTTSTRNLFSVDVSKPARVRRALRNFHLASLRTNLQAGFHDFAGNLKRGFESLGVDLYHPQIAPRIKLLDIQQEAALQRSSPPANAYHNDPHTIQVTGTFVVLWRVNQFLKKRTQPTTEDAVQLVDGTNICFVHDKDHPGGTNPWPAAFENIAYKFLDPHLEEIGFDRKDKKFYKQAIQFTDPMIPGEILKYGVSYHGYDENVLHLPREILKERIATVTPFAVRKEFGSLLAAAERKPKLVETAALIKASDMGALGLGWDIFSYNDHRFHLEMQKVNPKYIIPFGREATAQKILVLGLNFIGARELRGKKHISFMHPSPNWVFDENMQWLEGLARKLIPAEKVEQIEKGLSQHMNSRPVAKPPYPYQTLAPGE